MTIKALCGVGAAEIVAIAREAGHRILAVRSGADLRARSKHDQSPVTAADIAASDYICAALAALPVKIPVISEEDIPTAPKDHRFWLVDPLDGTREFISGSDEFTVNIALVDDYQPVFGVVYIPATGIAYYGGENDSPQEITPDGKAATLACRRLSGHAPHCLLSKSHKAGEDALLRQVFPDVVVSYAGSSLKYTGIARGAFDFSFRRTPTSLWDTAAAHAVLRAAGGDMLGPDGKPLVYQPSTLLNPNFVAVGDPSADWSRIIDLLR